MYKNVDNSYNKILCKLFFDKVKLSKYELENTLVSNFENKYKISITINNNMRLKILMNKIILCIVGYSLKNYFQNQKYPALVTLEL